MRISSASPPPLPGFNMEQSLPALEHLLGKLKHWPMCTLFSHFFCLSFNSLRHRHNLTPVSKVCKAVLRSLFGAAKVFTELLEVCFEPPFKIGQLNNYGFLNRPTMACTQILVHRWGLEQWFWRWFQTDLTRSLVSSVVWAKHSILLLTLSPLKGVRWTNFEKSHFLFIKPKKYISPVNDSHLARK